MRKSILRFNLALRALLLSLFVTAAVAEEASEAITLETTEDKLSYVIGLDVAQSLKKMGTEIDLAIFMQAIEHVMKGQDTLLSSQEAAELKQAFMQKRREQAMTERKAAADKNQQEGEEFLASNKAKEGVVTTESGLQYMVIKEGDGPKPKESDTVTVHYRGTLIDGTEFDSSHKRGQPATFPLKGVIPGWTEGLQQMPVGSSYKFFIPANLAYGERGAGGDIGPNATLIFEVDLLEIAEQK